MNNYTQITCIALIILIIGNSVRMIITDREKIIEYEENIPGLDIKKQRVMEIVAHWVVALIISIAIW